MQKIAVIDLGIANVFNVLKAVDGYLVEKPCELKDADRIILPGVGSFSAIVERLNEFREVILDKIADSVPLLGICLGFQVLFDKSEEGNTSCDGLGSIKGEVKKFRNIRVPHMGWNQVEFNDTELSPLFKGIKEGAYFYFVHSYYAESGEVEKISSYTQYSEPGKEKYRFISSVGYENVFGVQFHPEKSGENGKKLLENFINMKR